MWEREAGLGRAGTKKRWTKPSVFFLGVTDYIILAEGRRKKTNADGETQKGSKPLVCSFVLRTYGSTVGGRARGRTARVERGGGRSEGRVGMDHGYIDGKKTICISIVGQVVVFLELAGWGGDLGED